MSILERVTGRKSRGLQMEEIACKCHTFLSLLSGRRKQTSHAAPVASIRQMSRQVSSGSAGEYQADERAGVARVS